MFITNDLTLLPATLAEQSISKNEIVLPFELALEAINHLEREGVQILGWEGWIRTTEAHLFHVNPPIGSTSLDGLTISSAAEFCRISIKENHFRTSNEDPNTSAELYYCITVKN